MEGLKALCVLHNVNVLVILKNMFYKISGLSDSETLVIEQDKNGEFGIVDSMWRENRIFLIIIMKFSTIRKKLKIYPRIN